MVRTTDAVIVTQDAGTGQPTHPNPLDMASNAEAAKVRDGLGIYEAFDQTLAENPYIDEREKHWAKKDSNGLHPWMVQFKDGSGYRVSRILDMLDQEPGSKWVPNAAGGVNFVPPQSPTVSQGAPDGGQHAGGGGPLMGGRAAQDPVMDALRKIAEKLGVTL